MRLTTAIPILTITWVKIDRKGEVAGYPGVTGIVGCSTPMLATLMPSRISHRANDIRCWLLSVEDHGGPLSTTIFLGKTVATKNLLKALSDSDSEIQINFAAPIHLSALFIPHLIKQPEAAIINVSSGLGFVPMAMCPIYCATKAALHSYTMSLRHQLSITSVKVFEAIPPLVVSELGHRSPEINSRAMPTAACVEEILEGFSTDQYEIGIGMAEGLRTASHAEFVERFQQMNG